MLSTYGLPLGDAFQMRDDVLGAFGDTAITGKPVGDDLREGKPTPLMAIATARANAAQLKELQLVGNQDLTPAQIARVQEVIRETGAELIRFSEDIDRDFPNDELVKIRTHYEMMFRKKNVPIKLISYRP